MSLLQKIDRKKKTFKNSCPTNSELIDGVCYDPCPTGFALDPTNKKKCIVVSESISRKKSSDPILECPNGYEDLNGKCYKLCSGDFIESQDRTMCISKDFTTTKNREFVSLQSSCPPGFTLDQATDKCLEICSGEWQTNPNNSQECLKTSSSEFLRNKTNLQCPDGTQRINDTCYKPCDALNTGNFIFEYSNLNENADTTCSKYYLNTESIADVCPDGTTNIGGNCFNCPEGYEFNTEKTKCIKNDGTERYKENLQCIDAYLAYDPTGIYNPKNYKCYAPCATGQNEIIESNTPKCEIFTDRPKDITTSCPAGSERSSDGTKCIADPVTVNTIPSEEYTVSIPGTTYPTSVYNFNKFQGSCGSTSPNKKIYNSGQITQYIRCHNQRSGSDGGWLGNFEHGQCPVSTHFVKYSVDTGFNCMKCPDGFIANTSTGKCEKAISDQVRCTGIGKTWINGACYDACPTGKTIAPDTTKCLEKQNRLIDNSKLRAVNINHKMIGEFAYGVCPPDYIAEDWQTSVKCLKQIDRNVSNKICPPGYVRNTTNNTCVKACQDSYTLQYKSNDAICMSNTKESRPVLPKECPTGYDEQINSMCYQNCENVQTTDRTKCVTTALNETKTRGQTEPSFSCPENSIRIDPDGEGGNPAQCFYPCELDTDPNFSTTITENTTCKTKTKQSREITQKINKCPDKSVFLNNTCLEECPEGFTVDEQTGLLCVPITKESKDRTSKSSIRLCESNEELINNECYEVCPSGYSLDPQDKTKCIKDSAEPEEEEESFIEKNLIYIIIAAVILLILLGVGIFFIMKKNPEIQNI
jgi:hypothetical protein